MRIKKKRTKSRDRNASGLSGSSKGKGNSALKSGSIKRSKEMRASMSPNSSKLGGKNKMSLTVRDDFMKTITKKEGGDIEMIAEPVKIKDFKVKRTHNDDISNH
jgi:hypothetical protein